MRNCMNFFYKSKVILSNLMVKNRYKIGSDLSLNLENVVNHHLLNLENVVNWCLLKLENVRKIDFITLCVIDLLQ